jgi:hypothetical protein
MSDMKTTRPDFPHHEVFMKVLGVVRPYTSNVQDLVVIFASLTVYCARFLANSAGKKLEPELLTKAVLDIYRRTDDETAHRVLYDATKQ